MKTGSSWEDKREPKWPSWKLLILKCCPCFKTGVASQMQSAPFPSAAWPSAVGTEDPAWQLPGQMGGRFGDQTVRSQCLSSAVQGTAPVSSWLLVLMLEAQLLSSSLES